LINCLLLIFWFASYPQLNELRHDLYEQKELCIKFDTIFRFWVSAPITIRLFNNFNIVINR
jgi:hypothetical protein